MVTTSQKNSSDQPAPTPAWVNKMMIWLLRSPLHGTVSKKMMLMTVTGRKSGKKCSNSRSQSIFFLKKKGRCWFRHFWSQKEKNQVMKWFQNQPVFNHRQARTAAGMET